MLSFIGCLGHGGYSDSVKLTKTQEKPYRKCRKVLRDEESSSRDLMVWIQYLAFSLQSV